MGHLQTLTDRLKSRSGFFLLLVATALCLTFAFQNCGTKANFDLSSDAQLAAQGIYDVDFSFAPTAGATQPVDLVWVIDNSSSMALEATYVRQNFQAFAARLESQTDFKLALISKVGTSGSAVSLPATGARYLQLNLDVNSSNALELVARALCPSGQSCGGVVGSGAFNAFLRPLSKKIVVVVTDDDSAMSAARFRQAFQSVYPATQLAVFGFVGQVLQPDCTISAVGSVYQALAAATGGTAYDICMTDWTSTFSRLAAAVVDMSRNTMTLNADGRVVAGILSVNLNGVLLQTSDYSLQNGVLTIRPSLLAGLALANVHVQYQTTSL